MFNSHNQNLYRTYVSGCAPLNPQVIFKANNHIYKKRGFSKFDHTFATKKTYQNELEEWTPDRWALASGSAFIILDLLGNMGESVGPAHWPKADDFGLWATIDVTWAVWRANRPFTFKVPKPNTKTTQKGMCLKPRSVPERGKKTARFNVGQTWWFLTATLEFASVCSWFIWVHST